MDPTRVALSSADLWRLSIGRLLRPDALAVLLYRFPADRRLYPLFAVFRKLEDGPSWSSDDLVVWNGWLCCSTSNDRLSFPHFRTPVAASGTNTRSTLVPWTATIVCNLDQLPWVIFFRDRTSGIISIQFLLRFSDWLAHRNKVGFTPPPNDDPGTAPVGGGIVLKSRRRQDDSLPVEHHAGYGYEVQSD